MKKVISYILLFAMVFSLVACSGKGTGSLPGGNADITFTCTSCGHKQAEVFALCPECGNVYVSDVIDVPQIDLGDIDANTQTIYKCDKCSYITTEKFSVCPVCSSTNITGSGPATNLTPNSNQKPSSGSTSSYEKYTEEPMHWYACGNCGYVSPNRFSNCPECSASVNPPSASSKPSSSTTTNNGTFGSDPYADIPSELNNTTVDVLFWRPPTHTETELVKAFEKKTGIKVNLISTPNNTAAYTTKLASLISSGDSPDVVNIGSGTFPSFAISSLEPLDTEIFRLNDSFWNKKVMDKYKINGNYYGVAVAGSWYCDQNAYVTYYYPEKLKAMGITTMPYDLYKQGKWNTDAVETIARKVHERGSSYIGVSIQTNTISNPYMLAAGVDFVKYNGKEYTSNLSDATVLKYQQMLAQWYQDGLVGGWNSTGLQNGTVGLFDAISYGMYAEAGWFTTIDPSVLDCVPVAGNATPASPSLWGVAKGADNARAAVYFLRFFLDPKSFSYTSFGSMKATFEDAQMYEVWQIITDSGKARTENFTFGCLSYYDPSAYSNFTTKLSTTTSANIKTALDEYGATMKAACNRANKYLGRAQKQPSYK